MGVMGVMGMSLFKRRGGIRVGNGSGGIGGGIMNIFLRDSWDDSWNNG